MLKDELTSNSETKSVCNTMKLRKSENLLSCKEIKINIYKNH